MTVFKKYNSTNHGLQQVSLKVQQLKEVGAKQDTVDTKPYAKVRVIKDATALLKKLGVKQSEARLYLEVCHGNKQKGELKKQLIPLPLRPLNHFESAHAERERFDLKFIADCITFRTEVDKHTTSIKGGTDSKLDTSLCVHIPTSGGRCSFELMPDGSVKLNNVPSNLALTLETPANIEFVRDLHCHALDLHAKNITNAYQVLAQNLRLFCVEGLTNFGILFGEQQVNVHICGALLNGLDSVLASGQVFNMQSGFNSQNNGWIAGSTLRITGDDFINDLHGKIFGDEVCDLYLNTRIKNYGGIGVKHHKAILKICAQELLNGLEGFIHSTCLLRLNATHIESWGEILTARELYCDAYTLNARASGVLLSGQLAVLHCLQSALIQGLVGAKAWMQCSTPVLHMGVSGKLGGYGFVKLDYGNTLQNHGGIFGGRYLWLNGILLRNAKEGWIYSYAHNDIESDYYVNNGMHVACAFLKIDSVHGDNQGELFAKKATLTFEQEFTHQGTIKTEQKLNLLTAFLNQGSGDIVSKNDLALTVRNWVLAGHVAAGRDFLAIVNQQWDWRPSGQFGAKRMAALYLDKGYHFTRPIVAPGSLSLYCQPTAQFHNETDVLAAQDLILSGGSVVNGTVNGAFGRLHALRQFKSVGTSFDNGNGGVFGGTAVIIIHEGNIKNGKLSAGVKAVTRCVLKNNPNLNRRGEGLKTYSEKRTMQARWYFPNGSYLASAGDMSLSSKTQSLLNDGGVIDVNGKLSIQLREMLNNQSGDIYAGWAFVQAKHVRHYLLSMQYGNSERAYVYVLTKQPIFRIQRDCTFQSSVEAIGGDILTGGYLHFFSDVKTQIVEDYDYFKHTGIASFRKHKYRGGRTSYDISQEEKVTHAVFSANIFAKQSIQGHNALARYHFESKVQTKFLDLQFSKMTIGNILDTRCLKANALECGVFAQNAILTGGVHSSLIITGKLKIEERLKLKVDHLALEQRTVQDYLTAFSGKKGRVQSTVAVSTPLQGTGILQAHAIEAKVGTYSQKGGTLQSGKGGTQLTIERTAVIQALRITQCLQGKQNFSFLPDFDPAWMLSEGNQHIMVTSGGFGASGLWSRAMGENQLQAKTGIELLARVEEYHLPTEKQKHGWFNKIETGGSRTTALHNEFSGATLHLSSTGGNVHLNHTNLISMGNATLQGKEVIIDAAESQAVDWCKARCQQGLNIQKSRLQQTWKSPLLSTLVVSENLIVNAQNKILFGGIQGLIQHNLNLQAPLVEMSGAKEEMTISQKTCSFGMSFFGASALQIMQKNGSARKAIGHLLREDVFLNAVSSLVRARDRKTITQGTFQTFLEGWRLAAMVGHACDANGINGHALLGSVTDRWGLTTVGKDGQRQFNPYFTFRWGVERYTEAKTNIVSSNLMVLGDITVQGEEIRLKDGTILSAQNITCMAQQLLEISAAENTYSVSHSERGQSIGANILAVANVSFGIQGGQYKAQGVLHKPAQLNSQLSMTLTSYSEVRAIGARLEALDLNLQGQTITFDSVQDVQNCNSDRYCVNVGLNFATMAPSFSGSIGKESGFSRKTLHSVAEAKNLLKIQAKAFNSKNAHLPDMTVKHGYNAELNASFVQQNPFPITAAFSSNRTTAQGQKKSTTMVFALPQTAQISKDIHDMRQIPRAFNTSHHKVVTTNVNNNQNSKVVVKPKLRGLPKPEVQIKQVVQHNPAQRELKNDQSSQHPEIELDRELIASAILIRFGRHAWGGMCKWVSGLGHMIAEGEALIDDPRLLAQVGDSKKIISTKAIAQGILHPVETGKKILHAANNSAHRMNDNFKTEFQKAEDAAKQGNLVQTGTHLANGMVEPLSYLPFILVPVKKLVTTLNALALETGTKGLKQLVKPNVQRSLTFQYSQKVSTSAKGREALSALDLEPPKKAQLNPAYQKFTAPSIADGLKLRVELALQEANILDQNGKLTEYALSNIKPLMSGARLRNPNVIKELTKDGSKMVDWKKYTTREAVTLSNGQKVQVHFYKNDITGQINYNVDYKVVPTISATNPWRGH